jgi:hypothetical protein
VVATELGLGAGSLCVEPGLIEECKAMRGRVAPDPVPVWDPGLYLSAPQLQAFSPGALIDLSYEPALQVHHVKNEAFYNQVQEVLLPEAGEQQGTETLDLDAVTATRCRNFIRAMLLAEGMREESILCVGHGATVKGCAGALQDGLPSEDLLVQGERGVSCYAAFSPLCSQEEGVLGPWHVPEGVWSSGDSDGDDEAGGEDDAGDRG